MILITVDAQRAMLCCSLIADRVIPLAPAISDIPTGLPVTARSHSYQFPGFWRWRSGGQTTFHRIPIAYGESLLEISWRFAKLSLKRSASISSQNQPNNRDDSHSGENRGKQVPRQPCDQERRKCCPQV